jgi:hypothetical protein
MGRKAAWYRLPDHSSRFWRISVSATHRGRIQPGWSGLTRSRHTRQFSHHGGDRGDPHWRLVGPIGPGILSTVALVYAVAVATFPDEHMYLATNWLHGIAPANTLDLHGKDLIDDEKLARIEKNENSADAQRWVATLPLAGRDLTGADLS